MTRGPTFHRIARSQLTIQARQFSARIANPGQIAIDCTLNIAKSIARAIVIAFRFINGLGNGTLAYRGAIPGSTESILAGAGGTFTSISSFSNPIPESAYAPSPPPTPLASNASAFFSAQAQGAISPASESDRKSTPT